MKKIFCIALLLTLIIPINIYAYEKDKYFSFSGLNEMEEIAESDIDYNHAIFVSSSGDDTASGTVDAPLKTITGAIYRASDNDTIYLREGSYPEAIFITKSNLTIRNYPNEVVKLVEETVYTSNASITVENDLTNIKIYGLNIQDRTEHGIDALYGILVKGGVTNLIIQNNKFTNLNANILYQNDVTGYNASGIFIYGNKEDIISKILIANNEFYNMDCGKSEAITVSGYVTKVDIIENNIHDIGNIGIDIAGHYGINSDSTKDYARYIYIAGNMIDKAISTISINAGIYVDGAKDVLVERNKVSNSPVGISIGQENNVTDENLFVQNVVVSSNLLTNNNYAELRIGTIGSSAVSVINSTVINNTMIHGNGAAGQALLISKSHDNEIINNVIYDEGTWNHLVYTDDSSTTENVYNNEFKNNYLFTTNNQWFVNNEYIRYAGTNYTAEGFEDLDFTFDNIYATYYSFNSDYSVSDSSPLIDAGIKNDYSYKLRDYNGNLRSNEIALGYIANNNRQEEQIDITRLLNPFPFDTGIFNETIPSNNEEEIVSPDTYDGIEMYFIMLLISFVSLGILKKIATL